MHHRSYKVLSYTIFFLFVAYVGLSQAVIRYELGTGWNWQWVLTGPARLAVQDNVLHLRVKVQSASLEMKFLGAVNGCVARQLDKNSVVKYTVKCSPGEDWIAILALPGENLSGEVIAVNLVDPAQPGFPVRKFISAIRLDAIPQLIPYFYHDLLDRNSSNIRLFYSFDLFNISTFFAHYLGLLLMSLTIAALLILLLSQICLFIISVLWQPEGVAGYLEREGEGLKPISFVDELATRFAIPLGFLGTVLSVWYSLEQSETDFTSFVRILDIMKIAIFTTVMGLCIKVLCLGRGHFGPRGRPNRSNANE